MPVTETSTYSLYEGKGGSQFQRVGPVTRSSPFYRFLLESPGVYDLCWKHDNGTVSIIRRDGAQRGGEE